MVIEIGRRRRKQPAPPHIVFDELADPMRPGLRQWLHLLDDEVAPTIIEASRPDLLVWSSLWVKRPDAVVRFELSSDGGSGTVLHWSLWVDEPVPADALTGHLRYRVNRIVSGDLQRSFGQ